MPPSPRPTAAWLDIVALTYDVSWDQQLVPGPVTSGNFRFRHALQRYLATSAIAAGSHVSGTVFTVPGNSMLNDTLRFSPPPFDVLSLAGAAAPAFDAYPLTILP